MRPDTVKPIQWPLVEPVALWEAKAQIGLMPDQAEHDRFLLDKIAAGRRLIERRLGVTLVATQYRAKWSQAPAVLHLPNPPLLLSELYPLAITVDGEAVAAADYEVDEDAAPATVTFDQQPTGAVVATYWCGVAPGSPISPQLKAALLMFVAHAFENRGILAENSATELPLAFETLLASESISGGW